MPQEQFLEIVFLDHQLDGLYDAGGYRAFVRSLGDDEATAQTLSEFASVSAESIEFDPKSLTHAFYLDAVEGIQNAFATIMSQGISSANPAQWLLLHDALTSAARLVTCPGLAFSDDVVPDDAIRLVALLVDVFARVSCRRTRHLAGLKYGTEAEMERRGESIRADIICGRVGAWLSFVDDLGRECAWASGLSWTELMNVYAEARQEAYVKRLTRDFGIAEEAGLSLALTQAAAVGASYDVLQQRSFVRVFSDGFEAPSPELVRKTFDMEIAEQVAEVVASPSESGDALRCYCSVFGVSAPLSVVFVPVDMACVLRTAYDEMISNAYGGDGK